MPIHVLARSVAGMIGIVADIIVNGDSITADTLRSGLFLVVTVVEVISRCAFNCKLFLGYTTDGVVENDATRDIKTTNKEMTSLQWQRMGISPSQSIEYSHYVSTYIQEQSNIDCLVL